MNRESIDQIRRLFAEEIPEIASGIVQIKAIAREPGYRTKIAVFSPDHQHDSVGACVGVRGARMRKVVERLGGERIDLIRWDDQIETVIKNALQPAEIDDVHLDHAQHKARVFVKDDQRKLAMGRDGQNRRLAGELCGYEIEIITTGERSAENARDKQVLQSTLLRIMEQRSKTMELIDNYLAGPEILRKAVAGMTPEQLLARPIAGKWSTLEVICHLADFEIVYADRIKRVIAEEEPTLFGGDPDAFAARLAYQQRDVAEELQLIELIRKQVARILRSVSPDDFQRQGIHSESGPLTLATLLQRITGHIPHHVQFIEEKRKALGI